MRTHALMGFTLSILLTTPGAFSLEAACESLFDPIPPTSREWIRARNAETNTVIKQSPNYSSVAKKISASVPSFKIAKAVRLGEHARVQLWRTGFGRPDQLALIENGKSEIIEWSAAENRNGTERIEGIFPSPDFKMVAITVQKAGMIDRFEVIVIDVVTRKVRWGMMYASKSKIAWISDSLFLYQEHTEQSYHIRTVDVAQGLWGQYPGYRIDATRGGLTLLRSNAHWRLLDNRGWKLDLFPELQLDDIVGRIGSTVFLRSTADTGEILKVTEDETGHAKVRTLVPAIPNRLLTSATLKGNVIRALYRWGPRHWVRIYGVNEAIDLTIEVPPHGAVERTVWHSDKLKLDVYIESAVSKKRKFTYDYRSKSWDRESFAEELSRDNAGIRYISEFVGIPSDDGTIIPTQIIRRSDVRPTGDNPSLVQVYGGFGISGYADDGYKLMTHEYLKRGGILVSPMVRGGNEFGREWYEPFRGAGKMRTIEDVVAIGKWLSTNRWSYPDKIALLGASNGGFIAAAAALLAPGVFGDVYPIVGVHELLRRKTFDPKFYGSWLSEYGDERNFEKDFAWLQAMSPADLARRTTSLSSRFFILVGREDSRVNPEHSYRFMRALLEKRRDVSSVLLYDIANTGHFIAGSTFENPPNWRANAVLWSLILDRAQASASVSSLPSKRRKPR